MSAILSIQNVTRRFGGVVALENVTFEVPRGIILGLIGPNGSGKTTLLNVVTGVFPPSEGRIFMEGEDITNAPTHRRARLGIARTFQIVKPLHHLTVRENVMTAALFGRSQDPVVKEIAGCLAARPVSDAFADTNSILERTGLAPKADWLAQRLTIEDRKRLELARALAMEPRLLLLDEVMAGLNPSELEHVIQLIREINQEGVTVVLVEHVMKAIMDLSHYIVVLHRGRLLAQGSPQEVVENPEVARAYLGSRFVARKGEEV